MDRTQPAPLGRPRSAEPAAPELQGASALDLARWGAAACAGGLTQRSAAKIAGISRRHLQRLLARHADDPLVARNRGLAEAVKWEQQGGAVLAEAASRAVHWLRRCESEGADVRETAAALAATIQAGHRLSEAGSRRAKRLQPEALQMSQGFDLEGFLSQVAAACEAVRALPAEQQPAGWEALQQRLRAEPEPEPTDPLEPIDVDVLALEPVDVLTPAAQMGAETVPDAPQ